MENFLSIILIFVIGFIFQFIAYFIYFCLVSFFSPS